MTFSNFVLRFCDGCARSALTLSVPRTYYTFLNDLIQCLKRSAYNFFLNPEQPKTETVLTYFKKYMSATLEVWLTIIPTAPIS